MKFVLKVIFIIGAIFYPPSVLQSEEVIIIAFSAPAIIVDFAHAPGNSKCQEVAEKILPACVSAPAPTDLPSLPIKNDYRFHCLRLAGGGGVNSGNSRNSIASDNAACKAGD